MRTRGTSSWGKSQNVWRKLTGSGVGSRRGTLREKLALNDELPARNVVLCFTGNTNYWNTVWVPYFRYYHNTNDTCLQNHRLEARKLRIYKRKDRLNNHRLLSITELPNNYRTCTVSQSSYSSRRQSHLSTVSECSCSHHGHDWTSYCWKGKIDDRLLVIVISKLSISKHIGIKVQRDGFCVK